MTDKFIEDDLDRMIYHRTLDVGVFLGGLICPSSLLAIIRKRKRSKSQSEVVKIIEERQLGEEKPEEISVYPL